MKEDETHQLPVISNQHFRVATVSDAPIPKNAIIGELNFVTVVFLRVFAELTLHTRRRQAPNCSPISHLEILHIASDFGNYPSYFMSGCKNYVYIYITR